MLPASLLCCEFRGDAAIPRFLSDADRPWIRTLIDESERVAGRPVREVEARLREAIPGAPEDKRRLVAHLLLGFARSRVGSPLPPREVRAALFLAASRGGDAFQRTLLCGRALGAVVPVLAWTRRFHLTARSDIRGRSVVVTLASGDPIFPSAEPRRFDSRVEERFARDFARAAPGWDVIREPEPIEADGHLLFPDFAVHPRSDPGRRWLVEIVGFWTADYLTRKLERLRRARVSNLLVCIDEDRNVGPDELPAHAAVIRYRRRVDAAHVLEIVQSR